MSEEKKLDVEQLEVDGFRALEQLVFVTVDPKTGALSYGEVGTHVFRARVRQLIDALRAERDSYRDGMSSRTVELADAKSEQSQQREGDTE